MQALPCTMLSRAATFPAMDCITVQVALNVKTECHLAAQLMFNKHITRLESYS